MPDNQLIENRLENWARYYRTRHIKHHCGSIEGRYNAPWRQYVELRNIKLSEYIDWRDAELVEIAWRKMIGKHKLLLKYHYMSGFPVHVVCYKSKVKLHRLDMEMARAIRIIDGILDSMQKSGIMCATVNSQITGNDDQGQFCPDLVRTEEAT